MANTKYTDSGGFEYCFSDKDEINRGGEGIIYKTKDKSIVAKIFHSGKENLTVSKFNYLQNLDKKVFVTPRSILYFKGKIAGYTMEFVESEYTPVSAFFNIAFCQKNNIDDKIKYKIASKLIDSVNTAHEKSIIIGDFNQFNILVNKNGEIKLIDTDSYETPGEKHSGTMLEEIRDYLYPENPTKESDYFALSVIIFYLFTHTHPYKGTHTTLKSLKERAINKVSVLVPSSELKIPKCYRPISDLKLESQFSRIFNEGQRFLISVDPNRVNLIRKPAPVKIQTQEKDISVKLILENENIINADFMQNLGYIETSTKFIVFQTNQKAFIRRKTIISKEIADEIFIGNKNIILRKDDKLFNYIDENQSIELSNINFQKNSIIQRFGNILIFVDEENLHTIYIDEIINNSIKNERTSVSGRSFTNYNGFIQNIGGKRRLFYNTEKNIATTKTDKNLKAAYQIENKGIISEIISDKLVHRFFKINGLEIIFSDEIIGFTHIAYMPTDKENGFIFEPSDNSIKIYRTEDFALISEIKCSAANEQSLLFYTKSGIITVNENSAFLINKI